MKRLFLTSVFFGSVAFGAQAADLGVGSYSSDKDAYGAPEKSIFSGDLSVYGGYLQIIDEYNSDYDSKGYVVGGLARTNIWIGENVSTQIDVNGEYLDADYDDGSDYYFMGNLAGHISRRGENFLLGAFGSVGVQSADWWDAGFATVGVEGQTNVGSLQFYTQAGVTWSFADDDEDIVAAYVHGEARYFANPNLMFAANVGAFNETYDAGDDGVLGVRWGADIETKFNDSPLGAFVSYQGSYETEEDEDEDWYVHTVLAGLKLHFNGDTLEGAARNGATLKDMNPLTGVNHSRFNDWE